MRKTLLIGSEGSMGKRYQAILKHLKRDYVPVDRYHTLEKIKEHAAECDNIIIATPTNTHVPYLRHLMPFKKPMLCEKPITKDIKELKEVFYELSQFERSIRMTMQYSFITDKGAEGDSLYDYFRHGSDGLVWDCMQIIALAKGKIELKEESPVWTCKINGDYLDIGDMDWAYVQNVADWFYQPYQDLSYLLDIHEKVSEFERDLKSG